MIPQVTIQAPIVNIYLSSAGVSSADLTAALAPLLERLTMAETGLEAVTRETAETGVAITAAVTMMGKASTEMTTAAGFLPAMRAALDQALAENAESPALKKLAGDMDAFQTSLVSGVGTLSQASDALKNALQTTGGEPTDPPVDPPVETPPA